MKDQLFSIRLAAILGFLVVAIGAFGAHSLQGVLLTNGTQSRFDTAIEYHAFHTLAILAISLCNTLFKRAIVLFTIGILLFSGSLYVGCFHLAKFWNYITPVGGLFFLMGWISLFWSASKASRK